LFQTNRLPTPHTRGVDNETMVMMHTTDFDDHKRSKGEQSSASESLDNNQPLPPLCRQTVDQLQCVLDGELPRTALDADPHPSSCPACRERIAAAKLLFSILSMPVNVAPLPIGLTDKIVASVLADRQVERRTQIRRRAFVFAGGLAVAAGVFLAVWLQWFDTSHQNNLVQNPEIATAQPTNPIPEPPHLVTTSPPVRLGDEFSKAEHALLGSSRPITEPATVAPQVLVKLTDVLTRPPEPTPEFEPARMSLIDLPEAARTGLQPVTATTQKAFARLLRDVGAVQTSAKPN